MTSLKLQKEKAYELLVPARAAGASSQKVSDGTSASSSQRSGQDTCYATISNPNPIHRPSRGH